MFIKANIIVHTTLLLLSLLCATTGCRDQLFTRDEDFHLDLSLLWSEVSKDTHSDWYKISIKGRNASYQWEHNGFPDHMKETERYRLSERELRSLKRYIVEHELQRDLRESRESGKPGLSVHLYLLIKMDGAEKKASMSGMFNDWTAGKGNIDNTTYLGWAGSIVSCFKNIDSCHMLKK